jgi:hypothetical protein
MIMKKMNIRIDAKMAREGSWHCRKEMLNADLTNIDNLIRNAVSSGQYHIVYETDTNHYDFLSKTLRNRGFVVRRLIVDNGRLRISW